jgi:hypothetical protein
VLRGIPGCASRMEVVAGVSTQTAVREHREAPCSASPMVEANGVYPKGAPKGPRAAHCYVKGMAAGRGASSREARHVPRVFTEELASAWYTEAANGVLLLGAPRVPVVAPIAA